MDEGVSKNFFQLLKEINLSEFEKIISNIKKKYLKFVFVILIQGINL
jgi:hypothetical protein